MKKLSSFSIKISKVFNVLYNGCWLFAFCGVSLCANFSLIFSPKIVRCFLQVGKISCSFLNISTVTKNSSETFTVQKETSFFTTLFDSIEFLYFGSICSIEFVSSKISAANSKPFCQVFFSKCRFLSFLTLLVVMIQLCQIQTSLAPKQNRKFSLYSNT